MRKTNHKGKGKDKENVKKEAEADRNIRKEGDKRVYKNKLCKKKEVTT